MIEAFSGIGTQRMALERLGIEHEVVGIFEIDKYAIQSYEAIFDKTLNLGDISKVKVEDIPDCDLFTYSFPCQDISVAGKLKGLDKDSNTRSGLLWDCEKIIREKKPKYLLMENVKNLVGKKFKSDFEEWLKMLEDMGYTNYWQVLNAKDYGIPQNRERVFCVSILGEHTPYEFPEKLSLSLRMRDLLEDSVDEKFYLSQEQVNKIEFSTFNTGKCVKINQIGQHDTGKRKNTSIFRVYDDNGLAPNLTTMSGGHREPHIKLEDTSSFRVRKLTPKECWRLMGIKDEYFDKAQEVCSNTQLYKQAGNAIVVDVLVAIFKELFFKQSLKSNIRYKN